MQYTLTAAPGTFNLATLRARITTEDPAALVDADASGATLRVYIDRCHIKDKCDPMAKVPLPPKNGWKVAVNVPYKGEKVLMVYTDAEEQVYP